MTTQLNFFGEFNNTGVGRHMENAFFATLRQGTPGLLLDYVNQTREDAMRRAFERTVGPSEIAIYFWRHPEKLLAKLRAFRVFWWFFESDRLADRWLQEIRVFDEIWAPSRWARDVITAHGVADARVRVVPSGVNTGIYFPQPVAHENFVFLLVGKYEKRKSIDETVEAFRQEFGRKEYPDVQLWLKADFPMFPDRIRKLQDRVADDDRIRILSGNFSDMQMAEIYRQADAFVFPTKAEGFGLPCLEAISCGLPVITTEVSAQSEFLAPIRGLYAPVDYRMEPIVDEDYTWFYGREYGNSNFGNWAIPSMESLRKAMRGVYEDLPAWREKAARAAAIIHREFAWDAIGRQVAQAAMAISHRAAS